MVDEGFMDGDGRRIMGRKSQSVGKTYEKIVDLGLRQYQRDGRADYQINYPEIAVTRFPNCRIIGKAGADRTVTLSNGQTCHIEIKTWNHKDRYTYRFTGSASELRRGKQYKRLLRSLRFGALAFYLVCWRWDGLDEWRLHPVANLEAAETGLIFVKNTGWLVDDSKGWPDWLLLIETNASAAQL